MTLNDVGDRVKELRSKQNLFQKELALICGFDRTYLSRVESGKQNITIEKLFVICEKLNVSLKEFFNF